MDNKDKDKKLGYVSENLAVPEIHVDNHEEEDDVDNDDGSGIVYDNLAFPEIKIHNKNKDKKEKK